MSRFETRGHVVTLRGEAAVIEYKWEMAWTAGGAAHAEVGREVLVLARRDKGWRRGPVRHE